ncbi:MAG: YqaJ viral recombinase family protein [Colwellia sp.]|nr:YqaJ viral recombinase family protein [Colwellia sp.]
MKIIDTKQGSEEWLQLKVGTLTSTRLKKIVTSKKMVLSSSHSGMILRLIDENITGISAEESFSNNATDRGNRLEPTAAFEYEQITGIKLMHDGLWLRDNQLLHGCSPDRSTEDRRGAVEIKCLGGENHLKYIEENTIPDEHKLQVLNYFAVNEKLEWLDFVLFRPEFYPRPFHKIRVTREELDADIQKLIVVVDNFFIEYRNKINKYLF